ncbi:MAG: SurA N-terminal domain-containing protein [bacterium]|nr:SurA N-terminal domain-containing protein [bacterium]
MEDNETVESGESTSSSGGHKKSKKGLVAGVILGLVIVGGVLNYEKLADIVGLNKDVAAIVNGEKIKMSQVDARFERGKTTYESQGMDLSDPAQVTEIKKQILDGLINENLVLQAATSEGIEVGQERVDEYYNQVVEQLGGEANLTAELTASNLTADEFREDIRRQFIAQDYFDKHFGQELPQVTEEEIAAFYEASVATQPGAGSLDETREDIKNYLQQQKVNQTLKEALDGLKAAAEIEILI